MVASTEHFLDVKVENGKVRVEAIKLDGQPLETTVLSQPAETR